MKVLLVEDDKRLGDILCQVLKKEQIDVDWAKDSIDVFAYMDYNENNVYDIIILDWMLPEVTGPEICKKLRTSKKYNYQGGIIFLTAKDSTEDRVEGLEVGSDDYLVKPFENKELIARLKALYRRKNKPYIDNTLEISEILLNRVEHTITYNGKQKQLSSKEFELFDLLFVNINRVLPREVIIERIWGDNAEITSANLDSHIYLLRKKLKNFCPNISINLLRGIGYKLEKTHDDK